MEKKILVSSFSFGSNGANLVLVRVTGVAVGTRKPRPKNIKWGVIEFVRLLKFVT